jgi:hypothetical protein
LGWPRGFDGKAKEKQKLAGEKGLKPTADKTKIKADFSKSFRRWQGCHYYVSVALAFASVLFCSCFKSE